MQSDIDSLRNDCNKISERLLVLQERSRILMSSFTNAIKAKEEERITISRKEYMEVTSEMLDLIQQYSVIQEKLKASFYKMYDFKSFPMQ